MNTAKIIGITKPHGIWMDHLKADDLVAYVARVSNPSNQNNHETAPKLLRYLAKHKHWSPFEMVNIVMEIEREHTTGTWIVSLAEQKKKTSDIQESCRCLFS